MQAQRKQPSHFVQVARLRIETTIIGIDADDDADDAGVERKVIETTSSIAEADWKLQPFDPSAYGPFVQAIISQEEIAEMTEVGSNASISSLVDANEDARYLLLKADCATGEAKVVLQPWLNVDEPDVLTSDLCKAWLMALEDLGLTHMSSSPRRLGGRCPASAVGPDPVRAKEAEKTSDMSCFSPSTEPDTAGRSSPGTDQGGATCANLAMPRIGIRLTSAVPPA